MARKGWPTAREKSPVVWGWGVGTTRSDRHDHFDDGLRADHGAAPSTPHRSGPDVSTTQVAGTALGSVTAAYLGSFLGVAGTVTGAALTSVTMTVGSALYQRSLENTKQKAKALARVTASQPARAARLAFRADPKQAPADAESDQDRTVRMRPPASSAGEHGMRWPGGEWVTTEPATPTVRTAATAGARGETAPPADRPDRAPRRGPVRWLVIAGASAVAFVLAMLVITGIEGITGTALAGGGHHSTIGALLDRPSLLPGPRMPVPSGQEPLPAAPSSDPTVASQASSVPPPSSPERTTSPVSPFGSGTSATLPTPAQQPPGGGVGDRRQTGQPTTTATTDAPSG